MKLIVIAVVTASLWTILAVEPTFALYREITQAELDRIETVRQRIAENDYDWEAGVTSLSHLSDEEMLELCRLRVPADLEERRARARREGRMIEAVP